jgi:hypothetical protein
VEKLDALECSWSTGLWMTEEAWVLFEPVHEGSLHKHNAVSMLLERSVMFSKTLKNIAEQKRVTGVGLGD